MSDTTQLKQNLIDAIRAILEQKTRLTEEIAELDRLLALVRPKAEVKPYVPFQSEVFREAARRTDEKFNNQPEASE